MRKTASLILAIVLISISMSLLSCSKDLDKIESALTSETESKSDIQSETSYNTETMYNTETEPITDNESQTNDGTGGEDIAWGDIGKVNRN